MTPLRVNITKSFVETLLTSVEAWREQQTKSKLHTSYARDIFHPYYIRNETGQKLWYWQEHQKVFIRTHSHAHAHDPTPIMCMKQIKSKLRTSCAVYLFTRTQWCYLSLCSQACVCHLSLIIRCYLFVYDLKVRDLREDSEEPLELSQTLFYRVKVCAYMCAGVCLYARACDFCLIVCV